MKVKFLFSMLLAASIFAACTNEESLDGNLANGTPVAISLKVENAQTRTAINTTVNDEDAVINDMIVFVFNSNGESDASPVYVPNDKYIATGIPTINATNRAASIYVICNTGAFATGPFKNVTNLASLKRAAAQVNSNPNTGSNCISKNVWMSGNTSTLINGAPVSGIAQKSATIDLGFVPAKVYVIVKNEMTNYDADGNTALNGVAVINGGTWTRFVKEGVASNENYKPLRNDLTSTGKAPFFYNGVTVNTAHYADIPAVYEGKTDYIQNDLYKYTSDAFVPTANFVATPDAENAFYLFPTITSNKTYLSVYGKFSTLGAAHATAIDYYWSVAFDGVDDVLDAMEAGKKYIVTITLKGDADTGGSGDEDPTNEAVDANITVNVNVAKWDAVVEKEKVIN